jgi:signal transduction histidine kinase
MRRQRARLLATVIWATGLVALVGSIVFAALDHHPFEGSAVTEGLAFVAIGLVGWIVARRRPENPIGWLYLAVWLGVGLLFSAVQEYAVWAIRHDGPFLDLVTWLSNWMWVPIFGILLTYPFLLFPDGKLVSPRWRIVAWGSGIGLALWSVAFAFETQEFTDARNHPVPNPYAIAGTANFFNGARVVLAFVVLGFAAACVVSLFVRFRRAHGDEREQIKWLMYSGALLVLWLMLPLEHGNGGWTDTVQGFFLALIPLSVGVAILKYRLYDIDVVIRKTLIYAALAAFVTLVYIGIVVGIGSLIGRGDRSNVALQVVATAIIAAAFQPARDRATRLVNRIVYGRRATPYETLAHFGERVAGTYSSEDVLPRTARVLADGTGAAVARVHLRIGNELREVATWPEDASPDPDAPIVPVLDHGEELGALSVTMPANDPLDQARLSLIQDLASHAGLLLRNVRLIEELRASRQRLVAAQDDGRRRIERNIHDGAQQQLVALAVKIRLADAMVGRDDEKAHTMLSDLQREANDALENLRDLARGIYPPLLADKGLAAALEAQARKSTVPVEVSPDGVGRYPQEIEAAVYFCCLEAVQNAAKYAAAARATIVLATSGGDLTFSVADDGVGFDPAVTPSGAGLTNMRDRIEALGGSLDVRSRPGAGTVISGSIPVEATT